MPSLFLLAVSGGQGRAKCNLKHFAHPNAEMFGQGSGGGAHPPPACRMHSRPEIEKAEGQQAPALTSRVLEVARPLDPGTATFVPRPRELSRRREDFFALEVHFIRDVCRFFIIIVDNEQIPRSIEWQSNGLALFSPGIWKTAIVLKNPPLIEYFQALWPNDVAPNGTICLYLKFDKPVLWRSISESDIFIRSDFGSGHYASSSVALCATDGFCCFWGVFSFCSSSGS